MTRVRDIVDEEELAYALLEVARRCSDEIDVRLRVYGGNWEVWEGSPQYDTDHRGAWGSASVWPRMSAREAIDVAKYLMAQLDGLKEGNDGREV